MAVITENIQHALDYISDGDTINMPSGTVSQTAKLTISNKEFTLKGAGKTETILESAYSVSNYTDYGMEIDTTAGRSVRLEGFQWDTQGRATDNSTTLQINGSTKELSIKNIYFNNPSGTSNAPAHSIGIFGDMYGVISNCDFTDDSQESIAIRQAGTGAQSWTDDYGLGTEKCIFIEDCDFEFAFKGTHAVTGVNGARYVFRHSTVDTKQDGGIIDAHGNFFNDRGCYSSEVYENTFINSKGSGVTFCFYIRGGMGVAYNNTATGTFWAPFTLTNYRSWDTPSGDSPGPCSPVGAYTPNVCTRLEALALDSIRNYYAWNNTLNGGALNAAIRSPVRGLEDQHILENTDFFNSALGGYTPYTYPHPLA